VAWSAMTAAPVSVGVSVTEANIGESGGGGEVGTDAKVSVPQCC